MNIFFHIPRTGGTSLVYILRSFFGGGFYEPIGMDSYVPNIDVTSVKTLYGHPIFYGIHEKLNVDGKYVVFLREPFVRYVSCFNSSLA